VVEFGGFNGLVRSFEFIFSLWDISSISGVTDLTNLKLNQTKWWFTVYHI
jgi:hypothetical protein